MGPFARIDGVWFGAKQCLRELHRDQMRQSWRPDTPPEQRASWRERAAATRDILDTAHWGDLLLYAARSR